MPKHVDSHKEIACDFDWESVPASQEIRVVRREFPRPFLPRAKSADFARQAHAFMREPWRNDLSVTDCVGDCSPERGAKRKDRLVRQPWLPFQGSCQPAG